VFFYPLLLSNCAGHTYKDTRPHKRGSKVANTNPWEKAGDKAVTASIVLSFARDTTLSFNGFKMQQLNRNFYKIQKNTVLGGVNGAGQQLRDPFNFGRMRRMRHMSLKLDGEPTKLATRRLNSREDTLASAFMSWPRSKVSKHRME